MAYFLTSEAENAMPADSLASPKTHTPLSRLEERGRRSYSPEVGRWCSRDPIEEKGGRNLYAFVLNAPLTTIDALGMAPPVIPPVVSMPIDQFLFGGTIALSDTLIVNGSVEGEIVVRIDTSTPMSDGIGITAKRACRGKEISSFADCKWMQFVLTHYYDASGAVVPVTANIAFTTYKQISGDRYLDAGPSSAPWYPTYSQGVDHTAIFDLPGGGFSPATVKRVSRFQSFLACNLTSGSFRPVYQVLWRMSEQKGVGNRVYEAIYGFNVTALPSWAGANLLLGYDQATSAPVNAANPF